MRTRKSILTMGVATALACVGLVPSAAQAAPTAPHSKTVVSVQTLKAVGVDRAVAKAHGFEVRVGADGIEYPVKRGTVPRLDTRAGDCGTSFLYFTAVDTRKHYTSIYTGFDLAPGRRGAVTVDWVVHVTDNYGVSNKEWHTTEASVHSWHKTKGFTASGPTPVYGNVSIGVVILWDGTVCLSAGPKASARL